MSFLGQNNFFLQRKLESDAKEEKGRGWEEEGRMTPVEEPSGPASRASQSSDRPIRNTLSYRLVLCYLMVGEVKTLRTAYRLVASFSVGTQGWCGSFLRRKNTRSRR